MNENDVEHRSSDPPDLSVRLSRQIPIEWVAGGFIAMLIGSGVWAYNISMSQRDTSRDVVAMKNDLTEIKRQGEVMLQKVTDGVMKTQRTEDRLSDIERRMNTIEAKQGAKP